MNTNRAPRADAEVLPALEHLLGMYNTIHTNERRSTAAGHWINEAFVIRLCAVLEAYHVLSSSKSIDSDLEGAESIDICRRLRHKFAHATGSINDREAKKLDARMRKRYELGEGPSLFSGKFILSKDTVLRPMHADCLAYSKALLQREAEPR